MPHSQDRNSPVMAAVATGNSIVRMATAAWLVISKPRPRSPSRSRRQAHLRQKNPRPTGRGQSHMRLITEPEWAIDADHALLSSTSSNDINDRHVPGCFPAPIFSRTSEGKASGWTGSGGQSILTNGSPSPQRMQEPRTDGPPHQPRKIFRVGTISTRAVRWHCRL